jgi:hypothetical protein
VWVSDLLFPGSPESALAALAVAKGRGLVLAPHCREECAPNWTGNVEFCDSESDTRRLQHVSRETLARHAEAYARHFAMWSNAARRHAITIARVAAEPEFFDALQAEALRLGVVEIV